MVAEASTLPHSILNEWFQLNKQEAAILIEWFCRRQAIRGFAGCHPYYRKEHGLRTIIFYHINSSSYRISRVKIIPGETMNSATPGGNM